MEEDKFSKRNWELCKTTEQRQKYIEEMARMIAVAYGIEMETSLEHGVHIIDGGNSVTFMVNGQSVTESVGAGEGVNSPDGYIVININEQSFVSIVGVLCHEMRHELQRNMVDETNLKESKYVLNESEYADISKEVNQWRQNVNGSYISMEDSIIDVQKEEIWDKMSWIQKITKGEDWAEWAARVEVYEMYSGEPVEVDARYMEEYAESIMFMRQIMDTMHISSARRGQGTGGVMGSR